MGVAWLGDTPREAISAPYTHFIGTYLLYTEARDPAFLHTSCFLR